MRASTLSSYSGQAALPGGKADTVDESPFQVARREAEEEVGLPRDGDGPRRMPKGFWVEELCEMPTNLAKTELAVRPCVAFLHNSTITKTNVHGKEETTVVEGGSVEENMLPRLDAREVAAVFSAPFRNLLYMNDLPETKLFAIDGESSLTSTRPANGTPPGKWYTGSWTDWHQQRWRMHNFYVPVSNQVVHKPKHIEDGKQQHAVDHLEGKMRYKVFGMTARILVDCARHAYDQDPEFENNSHFGDEEMIGRLRKIGKLGDIRRPGEALTKQDLRKAANL